MFCIARYTLATNGDPLKITFRSYCLLLCLLFTSVCFAQSSAGGGTIQGTVKDTTGASIPQARLTITHTETGEVIRSSANTAGFFSTPPLKIGKYRVRVEAAGMKAWESELTLETGHIENIEPALTIGQVTETVEVTDVIPLVTTTEPTNAHTLDAKRIEELPINGRNLNTLIEQTTPGVEQVIDVNGGVRSGGLMVYGTGFVQDGAPSNNREFGGSMNQQGLDSIGEVRVETSTSSARYNTPTSVIVSTKSGTNKIHGSLYETARNNAFGVARARQDVNLSGAPYQTPKLIRNEFGGTIGGPVIFPSLGINGRRLYDGRNRTFFFVSREGTELRQGFTKSFTVPTVAMREGVFTGVTDTSFRAITIFDPRTSRIEQIGNRHITLRDPFVNNVIPRSLQSPLSKAVWGFTPLPTDSTDPIFTANLRVAVPTNGLPNLSDNPLTIKIDHRVGDKDNFFIKANGGMRHTNFQGTGSTTGAPTLGGEANTTYLPMDAVTAATSWTHVFSSSFFVETNANYTWQATQTVTGAEQLDWAKKLGLPNPLADIGFPNITSVQFMNYIEGDNRRGLHSRIFNAQQNYSWIKGTHNIQFGGGIFKESQNLLPDEGAISGSAAFNSLATAVESAVSGSDAAPTALAQTGLDAANFFLGYAASYTVTLKRPVMHLTNKTYFGYAQDSYKVTERLTVFPGVRWDINPAFHEKNYQLNSFDVKNHAIALPQPIDYYVKQGLTSQRVVDIYKAVGVKFETTEEAGISKEIFPNNNFDIAPRLGFAYRMFDGNKQLVIRGGYGVYISPIPMRTLLAQFSSMAPFRSTFQYNPNNATYSPDGVQNYLLRYNNGVVAGVNSSGTIDLNNPSQVGRGQTVVGLSTELPSAKVHEWNMVLEKQVRPNLVARFTYDGKHGVHMDQLNEINPALTTYAWEATTGTVPPTGAFSTVATRAYDQNAYASVRLLQKTGMINTHQFTGQIERRFSKGLAFQGFYTLTNALRLAGNSFRDGIYQQPSAYLPGAIPATDFAAINKFENYARDSSVPQHRVRWNWLYDIPFGRGKQFGGNMPKALDVVLGGWHFSGSGTVVSSWFALPTDNWGYLGKVEVYGKSRKILDCRGTPANAKTAADERCTEGYLYFNGYISKRVINSRTAGGLRNGVFGLPENYQPAALPITPWPAGGATTDPNGAQYDTNVVYLKLKDGSTQRLNYDNGGLHPWRNQYLLGPLNWNLDASFQKTITLRERLTLNMNVDLFNVTNNQGTVTPSGEGISTLGSSYGGFGFRPRQLQLTARLKW
jgi:hypothetical protein